MTENEALKTALEKVKAQKVNFGFMERFNVDENWEVMKALEEIQEYRAIGTVEECLKAVEKTKPKKVVIREYVPYCPCCGAVANTDTGDSFMDYDLDYCNTCGQKLDWGNEDAE